MIPLFVLVVAVHVNRVASDIVIVVRVVACVPCVLVVSVVVVVAATNTLVTSVPLLGLSMLLPP